MPQVSTGELVEVMAINAIAPAILNARLKPLLEVRCAALANNAARSWNGKRRGEWGEGTDRGKGAGGDGQRLGG